jgi:hypothetical protein
MHLAVGGFFAGHACIHYRHAHIALRGKSKPGQCEERALVDDLI